MGARMLAALTLAVILSGVADAQAPQPEPAPPSLPSESAATGEAEPGKSHRALSGLFLRGATVRDLDDKDVGSVHDIITDEDNHSAYVIVDVGGKLKDELIVVPLDKIRFEDDGGVMMDGSVGTLRQVGSVFYPQKGIFALIDPTRPSGSEDQPLEAPR